MVQRRAARFVKRDYRRTTSVTSMMFDLNSDGSLYKVDVKYPGYHCLPVAIPLDGVYRQNRSTRCTGSDPAPTFQQILCNTFSFREL